MTEIKIPKHIMRHEDAALGCKFDLDGESLYSVKWYKDGFEFYRYVPRDMPPGQVFPLPGVDVELQNSTDVVVVLRSVSLQSTGRYRCEVSGEAPSFQTVSGHEDMIVVVTPKHGPQITGGQPRYQIGDMVRVNCTSAASKPVCHLSWLINGMHANRSLLRPYEPLIVGREGLEVARLGLEFRCVAKISSVYWQSNEESVESDKHQRIPVLESRETVMSKSRQSLDKSQSPLEDKQLKKSRRPAAATSAAASAASSSAAASSSSVWGTGSSAPWSRILASKSIARISLYALPVLIAFLCSLPTALTVRGSGHRRCCCHWTCSRRTLLSTQLNVDAAPRR
ncbi:GL14264 [Drosophila persimilis]|uniref:GL14264 n=1 Tax=Drosophila persimilis TaxID=7234 RepID=B4GQG7_DROPE|nr:GL14264 [Drosophila persimilis]